MNMLPRPIMLPALLAASVAVPYAATNGPDFAKDLVEKGKAKLEGPPAVANSLQAPPGDALFGSPQGPGSLLHPNETPLEGIPRHSLAEVLRMDVSKEWVYAHWSRKSTTTSDLSLYGVRVPLVTGTRLADVAGSLTYYFGHDGQVHKLSFRGYTGDTTELVQLVAQRYGLQRAYASPGEQLYQVRRDNEVVSQLHTRPAPVLWNSSPHDSFVVQLDLQRPETARPLPLPGAPVRPDVASPPTTAQATPAAKPQQEGAKKEKKSEKDGPAVTDEDGWKLFFPRSRVPKPQVDSLDDRRRLW